RGEAAPVGQGVVDGLGERRDHEDDVDRQGHPEEDQQEADPVERQRPPAAPGAGTGPRTRLQRCDHCGHFTSIFLTESSLATLSVMPCSDLVSVATSDLPSRKEFHTTSWSGFMP